MAGGRGAGRGAGALGGPGGPVARAVLVAAVAAMSARFWIMPRRLRLADLKAGDAIMVKTLTASKATVPEPGTAVMLIAGVEPIFNRRPEISTRDISVRLEPRWRRRRGEGAN